MDMTDLPLLPGGGECRGFVFLGEAGCGKSEIAVNLALCLAERAEKAVHFFDLDMTKPLFRSREAAGVLTEKGVRVHFEEQFMDAPTTVGGPEAYLRREDCFCVLDVGGDYIGARSVGQYAPLFRRTCAVYYVINPFRPWSGTTERIDLVLSDILHVTHLNLEEIRLIGNPNLGDETTLEDFLEGYASLCETVEPYKHVDLYCARQSVARAAAGRIPCPVMPLKLYFQYPWRLEP